MARQLGSFGIQSQSEEDPRNRDDLEEYAIAWLTSLPSLRNTIGVALRNVLDASAGMFLYLRKLQEAVTNGVICESDLTTKSTLPIGLAALYERWFLKRFPSQSDYADHYRPLFEVLLAACEPLPIKFVQRVLDWGPYDESRLVSPMSSFFRLDNGTITVFHKSLSDWLINSFQSGNFYASPQEGDFRLARVLSEMFTGNQHLSMTCPRYLLKYGAIHATRAHNPSLGAAFLLAQIRSEATRLEVGALRSAIDAYLSVLHECDPLTIKSIKSRDLAQLISRTDTRSVLTFACEELIARRADWADAFSSCPLDSRGATWVFAACWAKKVLSVHAEQALFELEMIRDIAVDARHPLNLPAAYTFKYVGLNRPEWLTLDLLEPLCKSWTYSRLVATSLLQQLALKGVNLVSVVPWVEFWSPPWQYNRNELDLLGAALQWKGFDSPIKAKQKTQNLMRILTEALNTQLSEPDNESVQKQALELFWLAGADPERCQSLLQSLDFSDRSWLILNLYLKSPIFEAVEVAAGVVANRLVDTAGSLPEMAMRARPENHEAWGAFMAASKAAIAINNTEVFFELVKRYADSTDSWCRGLAAQYLARWMRDNSEQSFVDTVLTHESLIRKLLHDEDIWPVQEVFHVLQEFSASLKNHRINWHTRFQLSTAPIFSTVAGWDKDDCDWAAFEASASFAAISNKTVSSVNCQSD